MTVKTGVLRGIKGTYTDLKSLVDEAIDVFDLEYNFTYNKDVDNHDYLYEGVVIGKDLVVNGHGYTISGNNSAPIFNIKINNVNVTLNNIAFVDGYYY